MMEMHVKYLNLLKITSVIWTSTMNLNILQGDSPLMDQREIREKCVVINDVNHMSYGTRENSSNEYIIDIYFDDCEEYMMNGFEEGLNEGLEDVFTVRVNVGGTSKTADFVGYTTVSEPSPCSFTTPKMERNIIENEYIIDELDIDSDGDSR